MIDYFEAFDYAWAEDGSIHGWEAEQYKAGWAVIGDQKPSVEQYNNTHQIIDQKANYLYRNLKAAADDKGVSVGKDDHNTLKNLLTGIKDDLLNTIYPVGCIEIMANSVTPAQRGLPGEWQQITDGFLYAHGAPKAGGVGSTGGVTDVTLTASQMPSHTHSASVGSAGGHTHSGSTNTTGSHRHQLPTGTSANGNVWGIYDAYWTKSAGNPAPAPGAIAQTYTADGDHSHSFTTGSSGSHSHAATIGGTGGGQPHTNMPPFVTVKMWKRTA